MSNQLIELKRVIHSVFIDPKQTGPESSIALYILSKHKKSYTSMISRKALVLKIAFFEVSRQWELGLVQTFLPTLRQCRQRLHFAALVNSVDCKQVWITDLYEVLSLTGLCHGDFSVLGSKLLKYLTRYFFSSLKSKCS